MASKEVINWWTDRGFTETQTGGNCSGLSHKTGITHHVLITTTADAYVPNSLTEPVTIGYYDEAAGVELRSFEAPNSEAALSIVLGERFAEVLREWLTAEKFEEMKRRNAAEQDQAVCHSHDFCDANIAMHEVFMSFGVDPLAGYSDDGALSEENSRVWAAAWNHALVHHLRGRRS
jgi:hypothetical protein